MEARDSHYDRGTRGGQVITYIATGEGWLYLAAILDLHTRKLVGWLMCETLHTESALEALSMAVERQRPAPGRCCQSNGNLSLRRASVWLALRSGRASHLLQTPSLSG